MKVFHNLKVGVKIVAGYVVVLALMVAVGGAAVSGLGQLGATVANLTGDLAVDRQLGNEMVAQITLVQFYANAYIRSQDPAQLDHSTDEMAKLEQLLAQAERDITQAERVAMLQQIKADTAAYRAAFDEVVSLIANRNKAQSEVLDVQGPLAEERLRVLRRESLLRGNLGDVQLAGNAQVALVLMGLDAFQYMQDGEAQHATEFDEAYAEAGTALRYLDKSLTAADMRTWLAEARTAVEAYAESFHSLRTDFERQQDLLANQLDVLGPNVRQTAAAIADSVGQSFETDATATNDLVAQQTLILMATMSAAAVIGLGLGLAISRGITRPLQQVTQLSRQIADGDLQALAAELTALAQGDLTRSLSIQSKELAVHSSDEVGQMTRAFNIIVGRLQAAGQAFGQMTLNLRAVVGQVADNAHSVGAAAGQLASTAAQAGQATAQIAATIQQVARGTQQQSAAITTTAGSVEQMRRTVEGVARGAQEQAAAVGQTARITSQLNAAIQQMAGNARAVTQDSVKAAEAARSGARTVNDTVQGMDSIKAKVGVSALKVKEMGSRSDQIGVILETIDDIASQTNLLALNAAIEAARAGEHGKGFAVVADEVRKLAERASAATKEIGGLIRGIQRTVGEAVAAMDDGAREVELGAVRANEAGQALADILAAAEAVKTQAQAALQATEQMGALSNDLVGSTDAVSAVVEENTAATEEMAAGSTEVTQAIENIASVSEENSAAVEEVSASAEEMTAQVEEVTASAQSLSEMAQTLQQVVAQFALAGAARPDVPAPAATRLAVPVQQAANHKNGHRHEDLPLASR
jgi:methyl-accepting chemotaxis protein